MKKNILLFTFLLVPLISIYGQIPSEWDTVKTELPTKLNQITNEILNRWDNQPYCTNFASNLLLANSNRGYSLFTHDPENYPFPIPAYQEILYAGIDTMLMALDTLGLSAVDLTIQYPILVNSFSNSQHYLDFYKNVVQKIRDKGFKLIIGCQAAFVDSVFGESNMVDDIMMHYFNPDGNNFTDDRLDINRFKEEKRQMIQTIIDNLHPDYLTLEMEPQTQQNNLFNLVDYSPDNVVSLINYYMTNLSIPGNIEIGAGAGTWDHLDFFEKIVTTDIDYIDFHIYPINFDYVDDKVFKIDSLADEHNKKLIIGESWCYKATDNEMSNITNLAENWALVYSRDVFDNWIDIDTSFIKALVLLSQQSKIELVNFFWPNVMFGQLSYDPSIHGNMTPSQILKSGQQFGYQNMFKFILSPIGQFAQTEISKICDTPIGINEEFYKPLNFQLHQNYPNPFNPSTTISYTISTLPSAPSLSKGRDMGGVVTLKVYDILGREIATLVNEYQPPGEYSAEFNVETQNGASLPSGVYFYKLTAGNYSETKKLILMK